VGVDVKVIAVSSDEFPSRAKRPKNSAMDNSKLAKYYKMPFWRQALKEYLLRIGEGEKQGGL